MSSQGVYAHSAAVSDRLSRYTWYVIFLLTLSYFFNYMDRMALAVLAPAIKADLHISDGELGMLIGLAFSLFYAVCGIPIARWADRGNRRDIIVLALAGWSIATALSGVARNFWHLFLARVGVGIGEAGGVTPAQALICDYVPPHRRPGVFALQGSGALAGMMAGMALAGALAELIGWRWTFVALGLPGIAWAVLIRFTLREPRRGVLESAPNSASSLSLRRILITLWRCRPVRWLMLYGTLNGFVTYGLNQWWPSFYSRDFAIGIGSVGSYLGAALGAGWIAGSLTGGFWADKAMRRDAQWPLIMGAATVSLAMPVALGSLFASSLSICLSSVAVASFLWSFPASAVTAIGIGLVSPHIRATAGAINILFTAILGFGLGPVSVGLVSDLLAPAFGADALRYALLVPVSGIPLMAVCLWFAAKALDIDDPTNGDGV